jgi:hypothetical protein
MSSDVTPTTTSQADRPEGGKPEPQRQAGAHTDCRDGCDACTIDSLRAQVAALTAEVEHLTRRATTEEPMMTYHHIPGISPDGPAFAP